MKIDVMSGVQPTGSLHLGNYLGAIRNFVKLQQRYSCVFCIVDLHALTTFSPVFSRSSSSIHQDVLEVTAAFLACGIDVQKQLIVQQSLVPEHSMLSWVFSCVARVGWLNRMTQFKEKAGKNRENASTGLFGYPVLMSADILVYRATHVPVGDDQKQHLELTRMIAQKFNNDYGVNFFPEPEPLITGAAQRIMSLRDGREKMSKSAASDMSRLNLIDDADTIARKIRKAKTDSMLLPDDVAKLSQRPEASNLLSIYAALSECELEDVITEFDGKNFSVLKTNLIELATEVLTPITKEMRRLSKEKAYLQEVLTKGSEKARQITSPIMDEVYEIIGLRK